MPDTRAEPRPHGELFGLAPKAATTVFGALVAAKILLLFILAWNSRFVMDEFVQLGWAKYLSSGLFEPALHPKALGYALFYKLSHLAGWDAASIALAGRMQTALLACATLAIVYAIARALGQDRARALAVVLILLCFSNFMERIFRTIAEPLAVFFAAAALLVVLRGRADKAATVVAAGVLSGLAFLATQKAVYFNVALGLGLVADAALARRYLPAMVRGGWLVAGWVIPVAAYCLVFGRGNPVPVAEALLFGPLEVATKGADAYGNLRGFVLQTLYRNPLLYAFCAVGIAAHAARIARLDERTRIALIFTIVITGLIFSHNQPWPYVFIMALPFMALWSVSVYDRLPATSWVRPAATAALAIAITLSFARNAEYLSVDDRAQLALVSRAERLVAPTDTYFDGVGMLPNRREPSTLWLDRRHVLLTLRDGTASEAYRIFANTPPKVILWSRRMNRIAPVVEPLLRDSYVQVAPNIRMAGRKLEPDRPALFNVPVAGVYALYGKTGEAVPGTVEVNGGRSAGKVRLERGPVQVTLRGGRPETLLLPEGDYSGQLAPGADDDKLFADVYS